MKTKKYPAKTVIYDVTCIEYGSRTVDVTSVVYRVAQIFVTVDQIFIMGFSHLKFDD